MAGISTDDVLGILLLCGSEKLLFELNQMVSVRKSLKGCSLLYAKLQSSVGTMQEEKGVQNKSPSIALVKSEQLLSVLLVNSIYY
jgi:hypothetical protein